MTLHPQHEFSIPEETARVARRCQVLQQIRVAGLAQVGEALDFGRGVRDAEDVTDIRPDVGKTGPAPAGDVPLPQAHRRIRNVRR